MQYGVLLTYKAVAESFLLILIRMESQGASEPRTSVLTYADVYDNICIMYNYSTFRDLLFL